MDLAGFYIFYLKLIYRVGSLCVTDYRDGELIAAKVAYIQICTEVRVAGSRTVAETKVRYSQKQELNKGKMRLWNQRLPAVGFGHCHGLFVPWVSFHPPPLPYGCKMIINENYSDCLDVIEPCFTNM